MKKLVFSFLRRPPAKLDLYLGDETFAPGDTVRARVSISTRKDFHVRLGVARLDCVERYWRRESHYDASTKSTRTRLVEKRRYLLERRSEFLGDGRVRNGLTHTEEIEFEIPPDAPRTVLGKVVGIRWQLSVSLDVQGARDLKEDRDVVVLAPDAPDSAEAPDSDDGHSVQERDGSVAAEEDFGGGRLGLELESGAAEIEGAVRGRIRVDPTDDSDFSDVRVELVRREVAGAKSDDGVEDQVVLRDDVKLSTGRSREWGFTLTVPPGLRPTTRMSDTELTWVVKAILARSRRRDHSVEREIRVDYRAD